MCKAAKNASRFLGDAQEGSQSERDGKKNPPKLLENPLSLTHFLVVSRSVSDHIPKFTIGWECECLLAGSNRQKTSLADINFILFVFDKGASKRQMGVGGEGEVKALFGFVTNCACDKRKSGVTKRDKGSGVGGVLKSVPPFRTTKQKVRVDSRIH